MRLRLRIQRHALPQVKILWRAPAEATSVAALLEQVNEVIPLEADGWGTEDYVVSARGGFECLHFQDVHEVLEEGEEVLIAPIRSSDIKARVLAGRTQIAADGRHLVDGVAFGKPYLKRPNRPQVHIPPRKRPRLIEDEEEEEMSGFLVLEDKGPQLRIRGVFEDADVSGEDGTATAEDEFKETDRTNQVRLGKRKRRVSFDEDSVLADESRRSARRGITTDSPHDLLTTWQDDNTDDEDEEDDEDFEGTDTDSDDSDSDASQSDDRLDATPNSGSDSNSISSDSSSDGASDSSSDSSSDLSSDVSDSSSSSESDSDSDSDSGSDSDSDSEIDDSAILNDISPTKKRKSEQKEKSSKDSKDKKNEKAPLPKGKESNKKVADGSHTISFTQEQTGSQRSAPGQGKQGTSSRNQRRKIALQLAKLKSLGILSSDAQKKDLIEYKARNGEQNSEALVLEESRQKLLQSISSGGVDVDEPMGSSNYTNRSDEPGTESKTSVHTAQLGYKISPVSDFTSSQSQMNKEEISVEETSRQRNRLDVASSRRLLFGSLGLKAPKSKVEEEAIKAKLMTLGERKPIIKDFENTFSQSNDGNPKSTNDDQINPLDAWKSKIALSAVECCDSNVTLSTPPFPFVQNWDTIYRSGTDQLTQQIRKDTNPKSKKKKKKKATTVLNYDDEFIAESSAGIHSQLSASNRSPSIQDTTPVLPSDPSTLPNLEIKDIAVNTVIAYKILELSEATSWQPTISSYRTATITHVESSDQTTFQARLAARDHTLRERTYDADGRRVYGRFEMPDQDTSDNAESDDGALDLAFSDLVAPKLVVAATISPADSAVEETQFPPQPDSQSQAQSQLDSQSQPQSHRNSDVDASQNILVPDSLPAADTAMLEAQLAAELAAATQTFPSVEGDHDNIGHDRSLSSFEHERDQDMDIGDNINANDISHSAGDDAESLLLADVQAAQLPATLGSGVWAAS